MDSTENREVWPGSLLVALSSWVAFLNVKINNVKTRNSLDSIRYEILLAV